MKKKLLLIFAIGFIFILGIIFYINRSHLGYFEYLFATLTNSEVRLLEERLMKTLEENPEELFQKFSEELDKYPQNKNVCHGIAHELGHESFELYGFEKSMNISKPLCGAGFVHGIIESRFGTFADEDTLSDQIDICAEEDQSCNHGLGHGLMVLTENKFEKALMFCDSLKPLARSDCYDGVFMHIFDNEETGVSKIIPERQEKAGLCKRVDEKYQKSCSFYLPRIHLFEKNMKSDVVDTCNELSDENHITCVVGVGTMFGKYMYNNYAKAKNNCDEFGVEKALCLEGVDLYREDVF